ncbi:hypothetical protein ACLOAV_004802 [Pseudogymnoascus australis]
MPLEYYKKYANGYQFPAEQAAAIIRTASYHRKDFDIAVISFPDSEHQVVRTSISTSFPRFSSTSTNAGIFDRLPQELLNDIFLSLDINSLIKCRQVSLPLRQAIDCLPEYQAVSTHGIDALCALLRTRLAYNVSLSDFYQALCTSKCSLCSRFAGFISLPAWRRCCFVCLKLENPELQMLDVDLIHNNFGIYGAAIRKLTSFATLPGTYTTLHSVESKGLTIASTGQISRTYHERYALQRVGRVGFPQDSTLAYMATCALPYYDRQNGTADYGISCAAAQLTIEKTTASLTAMKVLYVARDTVYSKEEFLEHFKECEQAQLLWESSKDGTIEPPELPQMAKDGGVFLAGGGEIY